MLNIENFINGEFVGTKSYLQSFNPATGEAHALVPESSAEDVEKAVSAAEVAFESWQHTSAQQRSDIMMKVAKLLEEQFDKFAEMESKDQGKPVWLAKLVDIPRLILNFKFFATAILHDENIATQQPEFSTVSYTVKTPCGVVGLITPWNLPVYLLSFKIAPAMAAGCCIVAKPSEMTSVTAWMLCKVFKEAGVPPGVVNIVFGTGPKVGSPLVVHPRVRVISFTGSTVVGKFIQEKSAPFVKKLSLELGGKNAGIIFDDADLEKCINVSLKSAFSNQGEICLCTSRLFVHENIYDDFCKRYVEAVRKNMVVGPPELDTSKVGALVSFEHMNKVKGYIRKAIEEGGKVLCGETVDEPLDLGDKYKKGYYCRPTVIVGLADSSTCMQEEIFGPVVCISSFKEEKEVIKRANKVDYGLAASLWSRDVSKIHRIAKQLHAGTIWCNCWLVRDLRMPFGGMKMSGIGREDHKHSIEFFSDTKTICIQY